MKSRIVREVLANLVFPEGEKERRELEQRLAYDEATGVSGGRALTAAAKRLDPDPDWVAIAYDVNNFKATNETEFGHAEGDRMIRYTARVLLLVADEFELTNRHVFRRYEGGDEFVVLCPRTVAPAFLLLSEMCFGTNRYPLGKVSLTGVIADTMAEADLGLKAAKAARKSR